jgi:preprotein translocase subunit SecF
LRNKKLLILGIIVTLAYILICVYFIAQFTINICMETKDGHGYTVNEDKKQEDSERLMTTW